MICRSKTQTHEVADFVIQNQAIQTHQLQMILECEMQPPIGGGQIRLNECYRDCINWPESDVERHGAELVSSLPSRLL